MQPPATGLGEQLRLAREDRNLSLGDVANVTRIAPWALAAIEREDFGRLPGGVYRLGFVKAYADAVGLDGADFARRVAALHDSPEAVPVDAARTGRRLGGGRFAGMDWPVVAAVTAAIAMSAVALQLVFRLHPGTPAADRPGPFEPPVGGEPLADPSAVGGMAVEAVPQAALRVRVVATGHCLVSATADGTPLVPRALAAGESVSFAAESAVTLSVADAGAVTYTINGRPARPLGAPGEPATVRITPATIESLLILEPGSAL
jgi:hypothetical protein